MKIHLRPLKDSDAPGMLEWMSDPEINCYFRFAPSVVSLDTCRAFIHDSSESADSVHYAIADERDEYLGTISLKNVDHENRTAEYAVSTRKNVHGTGAAAQATREILKIAFMDMDLELVYLNVLAINSRANGFYRDIGFSFDRCEHNVLEIRGTWYDLNWYSMQRNSFVEAI